MATRTLAKQNLDAECRAVEAGLRAEVQDGMVAVRSDSYREKWYSIGFVTHADGLVTFTCTPFGRNAFRDDHLHTVSDVPGVTPCLHSAAAARSLLRHGLVQRDALGRWCVTAKTQALQPAVECPTDLLAGIGLRG